MNTWTCKWTQCRSFISNNMYKFYLLLLPFYCSIWYVLVSTFVCFVFCFTLLLKFFPSLVIVVDISTQLIVISGMLWQNTISLVDLKHYKIAITFVLTCMALLVYFGGLWDTHMTYRPVEFLGRLNCNELQLLYLQDGTLWHYDITYTEMGFAVTNNVWLTV